MVRSLWGFALNHRRQRMMRNPLSSVTITAMQPSIAFVVSLLLASTTALQSLPVHRRRHARRATAIRAAEGESLFDAFSNLFKSDPEAAARAENQKEQQFREQQVHRFRRHRS